MKRRCPVHSRISKFHLLGILPKDNTLNHKRQGCSLTHSLTHSLTPWTKSLREMADDFRPNVIGPVRLFLSSNVGVGGKFDHGGIFGL